MFAGRVRFSALRFRRASATIRCQMPDSVLIVDDHPSFRASARALLESEGFVVVGEAADGSSALRDVARLEPAVGLGLLAFEASLATVLVATSDHDSSKGISLGLAITAGVAFVISGLVALARRPENRTGLYLAAVGYLWFLGALSDANNAWLFAIGYLIGSLAWIPLAALLLTHPTGRFGSRLEAAFPWIVGAALLSFSALAILVDRTPQP